jgi:hypothetical protein
VLGRIAPDISRIRITNTADGSVVWDVKPLAQGTLYLFEAWDGKGRVKSERFRL